MLANSNFIHYHNGDKSEEKKIIFFYIRDDEISFDLFNVLYFSSKIKFARNLQCDRAISIACT